MPNREGLAGRVAGRVRGALRPGHMATRRRLRRARRRLRSIDVQFPDRVIVARQACKLFLASGSRSLPALRGW